MGTRIPWRSQTMASHSGKNGTLRKKRRRVEWRRDDARQGERRKGEKRERNRLPNHTAVRSHRLFLSATFSMHSTGHYDVADVFTTANRYRPYHLILVAFVFIFAYRLMNFQMNACFPQKVNFCSHKSSKAKRQLLASVAVIALGKVSFSRLFTLFEPY